MSTTSSPTITPFLWFDGQAEEAMNLYTSVFKNSRVISVSGAPGHVMSVQFELNGQRFIGLNAGPMYKFNEAVSFLVDCETQEQVDEYWDKLTANGGASGRCGWLKDKFGLSWQIVPNVLPRLMGDKDAEKSKRVLDVLMKSNKLSFAELERAHAGK